MLEINPTMVTKAINVTSTLTEVGEGPPTGTDDDDDDVMLGPVKLKVVISGLVGDVTFCTNMLPFTSVELIPNCAFCSILNPRVFDIGLLLLWSEPVMTTYCWICSGSL